MNDTVPSNDTVRSDPAGATPSGRRVGVVRSGSMGDVLLGGPAVRAIAAHATVVHFASPRGAPAAALLPGVSEVVSVRVPWIERDLAPPGVAEVDRIVHRLASQRLDELVIFTSDHQSPLPMALCARLAGVPRISACSEDYPGSLLDVRHRVPGPCHEVVRALGLAEAAGFTLPGGDDARLRLAEPTGAPPVRHDVIVHPGSAAAARTGPPALFRSAVRAIASLGLSVAVSGGPDDVDRAWLGDDAELLDDLSLSGLADVFRAARVVVSGNTGPAHLAASVGTPVVSIFPPTVDVEAWRPWGPAVLLGDQSVECAGCRALVCPRPAQTCLSRVDGRSIAEAVVVLSDAASDEAWLPEPLRFGRTASWHADRRA